MVDQQQSTDTYSSAIASADNYTRWIIDLFRPHFGGYVLEVGLGHGGYRRHLPDHLRYAGTDIDSAAVAAAREDNPGETYFQGDISAADFADSARRHVGSIDSVLCANVLEHVADDESAVSNMLGTLDPGGRLLLYLPAHQNLYGTMDRLAGHHRRYTLADIARLAGPAIVVDWAFVNPVAAVGWWLNRRVKYESLDSARINTQIEWFDRWILPASRLLSPVTAKHFGLSLYCIIEHP